jgi:hypothetical protein
MIQLFDGEAIGKVHHPIRFDPKRETEPDISLSKYRSDYYSNAHPKSSDVLGIIEVVGSSIRFDREGKALSMLHTRFRNTGSFIRTAIKSTIFPNLKEKATPKPGYLGREPRYGYRVKNSL